MNRLDVRPVGDHGSLVELPGNDAVHVAARVARERWGDQLEEVVPGHETLLLVWRGGRVGFSQADLASLSTPTSAPTPAGVVSVPVSYDGADIDAVAATLEISREAVIELHRAEEYVVAFTGFAPGFPYLVAPGGSKLLDLPRLPTPRTEVPPGATR